MYDWIKYVQSLKKDYKYVCYVESFGAISVSQPLTPLHLFHFNSLSTLLFYLVLHGFLGRV